MSSPSTVQLTNHGNAPVDIESIAIVLYGGTATTAFPGEFELIPVGARALRPGEAMSVEVVFRPKRVVPYIGARLRAKGHGPHEQIDVTLKAMPVAPRAEHAEQRELSVAEHDARGLAASSAPTVARYSDMLAAVLAARHLTDRVPDSPETHTRVPQLLEPVARRLDELNDHQGRFRQFGAGNLPGQVALDISQTAIQSWLRRIKIGTRIDTEELVTKFRLGAEPLRFLTGERDDAPTLTAFNHASTQTALGAGALVVLPAVIAAAIVEAPLLAFVVQIAARRVALWALMHPAAALAATEALLGLGVQVGEDGWESFWDQLRDPNGRLFILAQVLMDFMHVKSNMGGHAEAPNAVPGSRRSPSGDNSLPPGTGGDSDLGGAPQQTAKLRTIIQQVADGAASARQAASESSAAKQTAQETGASRNRTTIADARAEGPIGQPAAASLLLEEIERNAGGLRRPALETIEPAEMGRLRQEFADLGGDPEMLRFNQGTQTGYLDRGNIIVVRGDVNPVEGAMHPRSAMSSKAALGHELGHRAHRGTKLPIGAWNDEFRASYWAAKNLPNLSEADRIHLILDAMERAKEAGVTIQVNAFMRKILYGY